MKYSISKSTEDFLKSIEGRAEEDVVNYVSGKDELDRLILKENLRIKNLFFDQPLDMMLIVLINNKVLKRKISDFRILSEANQKQITNFQNDGFGIHWIDLDFDLSLKDFLQFELTHIDNPFIA
jgi:hypothetical protein